MENIFFCVVKKKGGEKKKEKRYDEYYIINCLTMEKLRMWFELHICSNKKINKKNSLKKKSLRGLIKVCTKAARSNPKSGVRAMLNVGTDFLVLLDTSCL